MSFENDDKALTRRNEDERADAAAMLTCPKGDELTYYRCQCCGSWDVQLDSRAWFHPNRDWRLVDDVDIGDWHATWCEHCDDEGYVVMLRDYDPGDVEGANQAYARAQDQCPPWTWENGKPPRPMTQDAMGGP